MVRCHPWILDLKHFSWSRALVGIGTLQTMIVIEKKQNTFPSSSREYSRFRIRMVSPRDTCTEEAWLLLINCLHCSKVGCVFDCRFLSTWCKIKVGLLVMPYNVVSSLYSMSAWEGNFKDQCGKCNQRFSHCNIKTLLLCLFGNFFAFRRLCIE